jgi:hypothetical protein
MVIGVSWELENYGYWIIGDIRITTESTLLRVVGLLRFLGLLGLFE